MKDFTPSTIPDPSLNAFLLHFFPVSLQPFEFDPTEKNRHKFMVQSMYAPDGEINQDTLVRNNLSRDS